MTVPVGFINTVMAAANGDFSGGGTPSPTTSGLQTNGQMWIGSTAANAGGTHINIGSVTSPLGTINVGYSSPNITMDITGGSVGLQQVTIDSGATIVPSGSPTNITLTGNTVTNASHPKALFIFKTGASSATANIQVSTTLAATDASKAKVGLAVFDSGDFTVDANGFVSLAGGGAGQTITGDSGGALSPTAGNWNILGGPGVTTSGSGSTLTINSVVFTDQGGSTTVTSDSGSFATAAITLTLPASPAQGELLQFVCTSASALVLDAPSTHLIRIGSLVSSAGGTATSTAIGDSVTLRYRSADTTWYATSVIGTWVMA